jgi:outer membrane protein OmpA-like peptidoglycan-associated protein
MLSAIVLLAPTPVFSQPPANLKITVNSNGDFVQPDEFLTLREAMLLANGSLSLEQLSRAEQSQVQKIAEPGTRIEFRLPTDQTTIRLTTALPAIARAGLTIDGTTQPGYSADSAINELPLAVPIVAITPASGVEVLRGLTVTADGVTIRGLSLYGFTASHRDTAATPPADIFISHRFPPPDIRKQSTPANFSPFYADDLPPKDVVIEQNFLGIPPLLPRDESSNELRYQAASQRSVFGVVVFNAANATIRRNWIADHEGSGILTSVRSDNTQISENAVIGNGVAGMPDAIRLEGNVSQTQVTRNLICANDGSGIYLFKPNGAVQILDNQIVHNGRRLRRSAVYLMGSNHQVKDNQIRHQTGAGVVVAAAPRSEQNQITGNQFSDLEGLSIDLVTQNRDGVFDFQQGDGVNPPSNSPNRRLETANRAIAAPTFVSRDFLLLGLQQQAQNQTEQLIQVSAAPVLVVGNAKPGSQVELYRSRGDASLGNPIATTETDATGQFRFTTDQLLPGDVISAIATHPDDGTSEPARSATIRALTPIAMAPVAQPASSTPRCVTPVAQQPPPEVPPAAPPEVPPTEPLRIRVPNRVHFALDQASLSSTSKVVLNRIAEVMQANPTLLVSLEGHTDPRADDAYNRDLGNRRAIAVRNYLRTQGIAPERMTIRSFGETRRLSTRQTRLDYARDRRVELIYTDSRNIEVIVQEADLQLEKAKGERRE